VRKVSVFIGIVVCFFSCAVQGPPTGGPEDKTPPAVVFYFPPQDSTNIDPETEIYIEFSEDIDRISFENSLYVSPVFTEQLKINWRGKKAFLIPPEKLKDDVTYVFNIGTTVKDLRNNRLRSSLSWAFSTGSRIDKGKISGTVIGDKQLSGCFVWCFKKKNGEDLDPRFLTPDYITQVGEDGTFESNYMAEGIYRTFAFKDGNDDKKFTLALELIGIPPQEVSVSENESPELTIWMTQQDSIPPQVEYIKVLNKNTVEITFSEIVETGKDSVLFIYDKNNEELGIARFYLKEDKRTAILETGEQKDREIYHVRISGLPDLYENYLIEPGDSLTFLGSNVADTLRPEIISISPQDSSNNIPAESAIRILFSESVDTAGFSDRLSMENIIDSMKAEGTLHWISPVEAEFLPGKTLESQKSYLFTFNPFGLQDRNNNEFIDTLFQTFFSVENSNLKGNILGTLVDSSRSGQYNYRIILKNSTNNAVVAEHTIEKPGEFTLAGINPGNYNILIYKDLDGNERYSYGKLDPFTFSESFIVVDQAVDIRAGWDTQIEEIYFRY